MKRGCFHLLLCILVLYGVSSIWDAYANRPSALYEAWFGSPVPDDVRDLHGQSTFALTESSRWLTFSCPQSRLEQIKDASQMSAVSFDPETRDTLVDGRRHATNWFDTGIRRLGGDRNTTLVFWKGNRPGDLLAGGYALFYNPSSQKAYYKLLSI